MAELMIDTRKHSLHAVRDFCKQNGYLPRISPCLGFWLLNKMPANDAAPIRRTPCERLQRSLDLRLGYVDGKPTLYRNS